MSDTRPDGTRRGLAQAAGAPAGTKADGTPCKHPAGRLWAWYARDDTAPGGQVLCVACCDCGAVLAGGVTLEEKGGES